LERRAPEGQIRALVRSLRGTGLAADLVIESESVTVGIAAESKSLHAQDGRFQVDVAPGHYRLTISAPGYEVQRRKVEVEENGVTVLNVDLRRQQ